MRSSPGNVARRFHLLLTVVASTLALGCAGGSSERDGADPAQAEDVGRVEQDLLGAPTYVGTDLPEGTYELAAAIQRAAAVAVSSVGFEWCIGEAMRNGHSLGYTNRTFGPYVGCHPDRPESFEDASSGEQIARVIAAARSPYSSTFSFTPATGIFASGGVNVYGSPNENIRWYNWTPERVAYDLAHCLQADGTLAADCGSDLVATYVHETMHNHGYRHTPSCDHSELPGWSTYSTVPYIAAACAAAAYGATTCLPGTARDPHCGPGQRAIPDRFVYGVVAEDSNQCLCTSPGPASELPSPIDERVMSSGAANQGTVATSLCRKTNEDLHRVTLTGPFMLSTTEVTQGQFTEVMGYNPSYHQACGADCPVENVTWHEAAAYCSALSTERGLRTCYTCSGAGAATSCAPRSQYQESNLYSCKGYRLPTEAEWEYAFAAQGGPQNAFYDGRLSACGNVVDANASAVAWYAGNSGTPYVTTHPVRQKAPNAIGLHDMAGNVTEWVNDTYLDRLGFAARTNPNLLATWPAHVNMRVMKGGHFATYPEHLRRARRFHDDMNRRSLTVGFRCARSF